MLLEARYGAIDLRKPTGDKVPILGVTDCKSLYDAIQTISSPAKLEDQRVAIDPAIIRQAVERTDMAVRWAPTELMLADSLTKDAADSADCRRKHQSWHRKSNNVTSVRSDAARHRQHLCQCSDSPALVYANSHS